jgi:hypothetical protein
MFSLKDLFDLSLELDVEMITKITFAFHADIMLTQMSWPRHILNRKVDELLAYMEPLATWKQQSLIATLKSMKESRQTHEEAWPAEFEQQASNGKGWVKEIERIRGGNTSMESIYSADPELLAWWRRIA